jgi:hypothetical protein
MVKSNVTAVPVVPVLNSSGGGLGYYCAGRHCAVREKCHRHTSSIVQPNAVFDDYDKLMLSEGSCRFFVDVKEANRIGK